MNQERWGEVDGYITDLLVHPDPSLDAALRSSAEAGLPPINVSPPQGKLLMLLARMQGARRILEVGTLGGYSTIWLAMGLAPGGKLTTLELDPDCVKVASANIRRARLSRVVEIRQGPALETLPKIKAERKGPFDLFFIDADKPNNPEYFAWALKMSRPGSVIIVDNVVRDGEVIDARNRDPNVRGVRRLNEMMAAEPRVMATEIQTVGGKGYDGFAIAVVGPGRASR
jgi:predicted O-methyltransferase YrrM